MRFNLRYAAFILLLAPASAGAQDGGLPDWVERDPFTSAEDDPLGIDRADRLERVQPTRPDEEVQRPIPVVRGDVLSAIAGVRESHHEVEVELGHGLAIVRHRMRFASRARHAAEVRYRLAVPEGASLAALEVCDPDGCRHGAVDASADLGPYDDAIRARGAGQRPIAHAAPIEDDRGHALWIRAAPVRPQPQRVRGGRELWLDVSVTWVVPAPVRGARVRVNVPARGNDHRAAPTRIQVRSETLSGATANGADAVERAVERAPWEDVEVAARMPRTGPALRSEAWTVPCGEGRCARLRVVARPAPPRARDVIVLLDASPSTASSARGRIGPAVAALLSALPSRSRLRVAAFAARAEPVVAEPSSPTAISLVQISRALERPLGSATRFEAAWEVIEPWVADMNDPLVLLVGDGGLTATDGSAAAFEAAQRAGAEIAVLDVANRPTTASMREALDAIGERWIDAGPEAERAAAGHGMEPLAERISPLLAPVVERRLRAQVGRRRVDVGSLRAGEERVWEGVVDRGAVRIGRTRAGAPPDALGLAMQDRLERRTERQDRPTRLAALAEASLAASPAACGGARPPRSASAVVPAGTRLIPADTRRCGASPFPTPSEAAAGAEPEGTPNLRPHTGRTSLPERALLRMLRERIVPPARGCFREDRRGRAAYQRRAVFAFRLADREVVEARVEGSISDSLRQCLSQTMDGLDIPPFDGVVNVRYPIYVAPRLPPPVLSLDPAVADAVDSVTE